MSTASSEAAFAGGAPLTLRVSPRARRLRLSVDPRTGAVLLTVPQRMSRRRALAWAGEHRAWIEAQLARVPAVVPLVPGSTIPFRGEPHLIAWEPGRGRAVAVDAGRILVGGPEELVPGRVLRWLKGEALRLLEAETREYAGRAGVAVARVGIGDPRSRWGSCSSAGAIRYSWRLVLAPDFVRRATVAHEVAHRIHMHHGPEFHALVADLFEGDPRAARAWLKREGALLHRFGTL